LYLVIALLFANFRCCLDVGGATSNDQTLCSAVEQSYDDFERAADALLEVAVYKHLRVLVCPTSYVGEVWLCDVVRKYVADNVVVVFQLTQPRMTCIVVVGMRCSSRCDGCSRRKHWRSSQS